jgi:nucleoside-diphosphate-sugar epimerase
MAIFSVIGGSGFVGSRLCEKITRDYSNDDFLIIDKNDSHDFPDKVRKADVREKFSLQNTIEDNSIIINLAAEHRDDVTPTSLYHDVNINGARNICKVADEKNVSTIVFTSSVAVYGFAPPGTNESGKINPFNEYGRTKYEAEKIFEDWQKKDPENRTLVIVRPTVIFGERNRGNVYNLLNQIASGKFAMIGDGKNVKSMAYVENVVSFLLFSSTFGPGIHKYNYIDKPDLTMNKLVSIVKGKLGKSPDVGIRIPYQLGFAVGLFFDMVSKISGRKFPVSSIRIKKFCSSTQFDTSVHKSGFIASVDMISAFEKTIEYEFLENNSQKSVFYSE